jgi:hypothetical protein
MNKEVKDFINEFNKVTRDCETFCFITRAKELQLQSCAKLEELLNKTTEVKKKAILQQDEDSANAMLSFRCMIESLRSQLKMWMFLKDDDPVAAWDSLIDAQDAAQAAMRAHNLAAHMESYLARLYAIEQLVFPPQIFNSLSLIVHGTECSICHKEYGECDHLSGRPYMGEFCIRIIGESEITEGSIVENPKDKRCRVVSFTENGICTDRMTWRQTPDNSTRNKSGFYAKSILFVAK